MHSDCIKVDKLLVELADYKNDYADVAARWELYRCDSHSLWFPALVHRSHIVGQQQIARHEKPITKAIGIYRLKGISVFKWTKNNRVR